MKECFHCKKETANPKYCSKSCAAKTNGKTPKRKKFSSLSTFCVRCKKAIGQRRKICRGCNPLVGDLFESYSYGYVKSLRAYQKNIAVREHAKRKFRKLYGKPPCVNCGYTKYVEVCHIKGISTHPDSTLMAEINHVDNLIGLCPNCHWEFDSGNLTIQEIKSKVPGIGIEPISHR